MLHECVPLLIVAARQYFPMNLVAERAPFFDRTWEAELLHSLYGSIKRDPSHYFRIDEVLGPTAHLPDTLVWPAPKTLQSGKNCLLEPPGFLMRPELRLTGSIKCVHQLAEHVYLNLVMRTVAYAHG